MKGFFNFGINLCLSILNFFVFVFYISHYLFPYNETKLKLNIHYRTRYSKLYNFEMFYPILRLFRLRFAKFSLRFKTFKVTKHQAISGRQSPDVRDQSSH